MKKFNRGNGTKTVLDIDNAVLPNQLRSIVGYKQQQDTKIFLPEHYLEICDGCGDYFHKKKEKQWYFEQWFCGDCVEKWKQGGQ